MTVLSDLLVLRRVLELFPSSSTQSDLLTTMHSFLCGRLPMKDAALFLLMERMLNGDFFQQSEYTVVNYRVCQVMHSVTIDCVLCFYTL